MRLFKSRATGLIEQHLEGLGIDPVWWPGVKTAIQLCEQKQWFETVFTAAGPAPARSVAALLKLEPFVRGGVDWDAHPNPLLNIPINRALFHERLDGTSERWHDLYERDANPTLSNPDLRQALDYLRQVSEDVPDGGADLSDSALNAVWSLGSAGYCWRLAEEQVHDGPRSTENDEYRDTLHAMWADLPAELPRAEISLDRLLSWGACETANRVQSRKLEVWKGCPGRWVLQFDYFQAGFERVCGWVVGNDVRVSQPNLWYGWCFGFGLRDSQRWLETHPVVG